MVLLLWSSRPNARGRKDRREDVGSDASHRFAALALTLDKHALFSSAKFFFLLFFFCQPACSRREAVTSGGLRPEPMALAQWRRPAQDWLAAATQTAATACHSLHVPSAAASLRQRVCVR